MYIYLVTFPNQERRLEKNMQSLLQDGAANEWAIDNNRPGSREGGPDRSPTYQHSMECLSHSQRQHHCSEAVSSFDRTGVPGDMASDAR